MIPCIEDEMIPIDSTANPIEEDDEGEEYCDEDEDEDDEAFATDSGVIMVTTPLKQFVSDGIEMDGSDRTESTLFTEELMLSDATGFETEITESATDIISGKNLRKKVNNIRQIFFFF